MIRQNAARILINSRFNFVSTNKRWKATKTADEADEWGRAKPFEQMPGKKSRSMVKSLWSLLRAIGSGVDVTDVHRFQKLAYKNHGPIWQFKVPGFTNSVTTTRPEDAEKIFRTEGKFPERPGFEVLKHYRKKRIEQYASGGILITHGEDWWRIRSKAQPAFLKTKNVEHYVPVLGDIADEFINRIRLIRQENDEMKPDFLNEMYKWALESVALVGLNTRLGCLDPNSSPDSEAQKMIRAANIAITLTNEIEFSVPIWKYITTPALRQIFEAQDYFTDTSIKYINKTMEGIKNRPADSDMDSSILEEILLRGMSMKDAVVMMVDMLLAGIDTTSHSTSFLLYLLARNPEKQEKLRNEILSIVGPKGSGVRPGALNELYYLKACVKESMRMLPAAIGTGRVIDKDLVLSGYKVPKGTLVATAHQLIGRLEEHFPNANVFIPERWIRGDLQESHHHPYAVLPFGYGTRMCIGRKLAELEMWQLTTKILQNFRVEYHHQDIGCVTRMFINVPNQPLRFKFVDLL